MEAFNDLQIDEDKDYRRLDLLKKLIDDLNPESLNSVGLLGNNLRMKLFVYKTIIDKF